MDGSHLEQGGSWRPFWLVAAVLAVLVVVDAVLPGPDVPPLLWLLAAVLVLGCVAAGCLSARRIWTVRVAGRGPDATLSVGREQLRLADVDAAHLRAATDGAAGVDAGAPVLGGGWSLPKGRVGLPLRRTDGTTVLVPTRDPARLAEALLTAHPAGAPSTDAPGRVEP
ncbi:DUF3093 family protein [Modestobacter versicolor]|uniref:DUF3093 domain-containing protein n=1 Tax=Modestobacter versicolor TaxID=429133 RepID=A0A323VA68_9ACTN|nr:DUF3093 family protein [Modestobacter versicolor]MBB3677989.1 hypothetical protein [Modestobacter versicolor]PZA20893.1 hypothetical protein DMO24_13150 [Modestobacter versicolor]